MAKGDEEDESSTMAKSPKRAKLKMGTTDKAEAEKGTTDMVEDVGPKEPADPLVSKEDITKN